MTNRTSFALPDACDVSVEAYDILGRSVATIHEGAMQAGYHDVTWDASGLSSGVHIVRVSAGEYSASEKVVLLK
jgi:flagellar hook assembly protein FlgD